MKFLIQTYYNIRTGKDEIEDDFAFALIQKIKSHNFFYKDDIIAYYLSTQHLLYEKEGELIDTTPDLIPIGSVEFVLAFFEHHHKLKIKPINIPPILNTKEFLGREIVYGKSDAVNNLILTNNENKVFYKNNDQIKKENGYGIGWKGVDYTLPYDSESNYIFSEVIDIESEWRGFVHNGKLLDIRNYSGDPFTFPDVQLIKKMIVAYENPPVSYTIDVAITEVDNRTVLIEIHDFFSCGLYGFFDDKLPYMYSQWYFQHIRKSKL